MKEKRLFLPAAIISLLLAAFFILAEQDTVTAAEGTGGKVEAGVLQQLTTQGLADFVIEFTEHADLSAAYSMDWDARGDYVYNSLLETADRTQLHARAALDRHGYKYQSFFAGNEIFVWAADKTTDELAVISELAALAEVSYIRAPRTYRLNPGEASAINGLATLIDSTQAVMDWGIADTKANLFWTAFGVQGQGAVVASVDTGVQWDHPALRQAYKCSSNPSDPACWFDPTHTCAGSPCDNNGHGTHTVGTMVADDDPSLPFIAGMAPQARWIACKGCETDICSDVYLTACADWILAPNGNPANRPNIVNNSWGGAGGNTWFETKVSAWRAAGIFPAFSSGNNTGCSSLSSPGDYQASFASAAHDINRSHAFSSGPSAFGDTPYTKPNLSAPGVNICSTIPVDRWSCSYSGTSMASPHTAGAAALLLSCNPSLTGQVDAIFQLLQLNTSTPPAGECSVPADGQGNYTFGYGYLDVLAAGQAACKRSLERWTQTDLPPGCPDWTRYDGEYFSATDRVYFMGGRSGTTVQATPEDVYYYDPRIHTCTDTGVNMPLPVSNYTIATVNNGSTDVLCTFGGRLSDNTRTSAVQCYDPLANSVEIASTLPDGLGQFMSSGVAALNNKVYVFGGFRDDPSPFHTTQTWEWDPISNTWTQKGELSLGRGYMDVAVVDGKIYAFGGDVYNGTSLVAQTIAEVYEPASGTWNDAAVADLPTATGEGVAFGFDSLSSYALAGRIILAGGGQWPAGSSDVLQYNVAANTYDYTYPQLRISRANQAGFFIPGDPGALWVIGGRSQAAGYGDNNPPYAPPEFSLVNLSKPDIVVTPSALNVVLFPEQVKMLNLTLTNQGGLPLSWSLAVSSSPVWSNSSSPFFPLPVTGGEANPRITVKTPGEVRPGAVIEPHSTGVVLWDQPLSNLNQKAYVSQEFPVPYQSYTSFLADDFVSDSVWIITSILIPGDGWANFTTLTNATSLTWQIYADHAGIPAGDPTGVGLPPLWTLTLLPGDQQVVLQPGIPGGFPSTTRLNLSSPLMLAPGHYWLVFYPTLAYESGQFGRQPADTLSGYVAKFINPGNGFGYGTAWQDWSVLDSPLSQKDIAFHLEGELPWLSASPISGTLPAGGSQSVTVTFSSAGMLPSTNSAGLMIRTNDPEQPLISIPIRFLVTNGEVFFPLLFKH